MPPRVIAMPTPEMKVQICRPCGRRRCPGGGVDDRADERTEEGEGALDTQAEGGVTTELIVTEESEDGGEAGEEAEGHDV